MAKELERRHEEIAAAHETRLLEAESELRRRIEELHADVEAERGVLEARLQELSRRAGATAGVTDS